MIGNYSQDFGPFEGKLWLNCAHQGPLPRVAAAAAEEAIAWKRAPWLLTTERFSGVPQKLKQSLGRLINAPAEEIILGNSASACPEMKRAGMPGRERSSSPTSSGPVFPGISTSLMTRSMGSLNASTMESAASGKDSRKRESSPPR